MSVLACISLGFFSPTSAFAIITMDTMLKSMCQYLHRLQWQYVNIRKQPNMSLLSLVLQCLCLWNTHALSNILRWFPIYQFKRLFVQIKQAQEAGAKNASSFFNHFQLPGSSECLKKTFHRLPLMLPKKLTLITSNNFTPKRKNVQNVLQQGFW